MALVGKKMVEQMIKSKALVVISKSYCPFCHKVRGVVKKNNGLFTVRLTVRPLRVVVFDFESSSSRVVVKSSSIESSIE